jgi:hypothetical protein
VNDFQPSPQTDVADSAQLEETKLPITAKLPKNDTSRELGVAIALSLVTALVFYFSIRPIFQHFDYTARVALALMDHHLAIQSPPPSGLNEMIPFDGRYYSAFPLGAVLSVLPVAFLQKLGWLHNFPARAVAALIAGLCAFFFFRLSSLEAKPLGRRILLALCPIFGTWFWCNLGFGGAWQLALGFALLGEVGALYFTLVRPRPLLAGAFFALAFGNRTELILTLPVYLYLLSMTPVSDNSSFVARTKQWLRQNWRPLTDFLVLPLALVLLTTAYNFARFGSFLDFGHARIPNALKEPSYLHGLFSLHAIPRNAYKMFFEGFSDRPDFPYLRVNPVGCSIFLSSPFLFLLFRENGRYKRICWIVILLLIFVLWAIEHPGGPQFSYPYAIVLFPWMFLLLAGNGPTKMSVTEILLFAVSVAINVIATWQFLWTNEIRQ